VEADEEIGGSVEVKWKIIFWEMIEFFELFRNIFSYLQLETKSKQIDGAA